MIELKAHPIPVVSELPGRVTTIRISEVRARVSEILQERVFEQSVRVKEGDVLYRIAPRLFKVRVASAEAIRRHRSRGSGILNNQAYIGRIVFNRLAYRKNPSTERRVSRFNEPELHVVQDGPSLRIIDDAFWQRVSRHARDNRANFECYAARTAMLQL